MVHTAKGQLDAHKLITHGSPLIHMQETAKIYGFYNNSCTVRDNVGLPAGQPALAWMVKVGEMKYLN